MRRSAARTDKIGVAASTAKAVPFQVNSKAIAL